MKVWFSNRCSVTLDRKAGTELQELRKDKSLESSRLAYSVSSSSWGISVVVE